MSRRPLPTAGLTTLVLVVLVLRAGAAVACTLEIGESGLAGITAATPFEPAEIERAVPGCRVEREAGSTEGEPVDVLVIADAGAPRALVFPDWAGGIFSVVVESGAVRNLLGPTIGASFSAVYGDGRAPVCVPGLEEASGRVLCPAAPGGRLMYLFDGASSGPDGTLPPPAELAGWTLVALLWRPLPFEDPRWVDVAGFDPGEGPALVDRVKAEIDDPLDLARLVLYPLTMRAFAAGRPETVSVPDAEAFVAEYARRLTPAFAAAVRAEPIDRVDIVEGAAELADGRVRVAPACTSDPCAGRPAGIVAISMF